MSIIAQFHSNVSINSYNTELCRLPHKKSSTSPVSFHHRLGEDSFPGRWTSCLCVSIGTMAKWEGNLKKENV